MRRLWSRRKWRAVLNARAHVQMLVDAYDMNSPVLLAEAIVVARRYLRRSG